MAGSETGRVVLVNHGTAAEDGPQSVGLDGIRHLLPMHQVSGDTVAPGHVLPLRTVRIQLEIQVPLAILIEHTVGVVHPSVLRCVVICGAEVLAVGRIEKPTKVLSPSSR